MWPYPGWLPCTSMFSVSRCGQAGAALPRDDAVRFAVDAGGGRGQRLFTRLDGQVQTSPYRMLSVHGYCAATLCFVAIVVVERAKRERATETLWAQG